MAKAAKHKEPEVGSKAVRILRTVHVCYENIESARGRYMNAARKEREHMQSQYEALAALGISQASAKINVKIDRALTKIKGWLSDLEIEDRKMAERIAKAQENKRQLSFWADLPKPTKAEQKELRELAKSSKLTLVVPGEKDGDDKGGTERAEAEGAA
jgi:murein L,D-transpeptidase YcbB/YkuD